MFIPNFLSSVNAISTDGLSNDGNIDTYIALRLFDDEVYNSTFQNW